MDIKILSYSVLTPEDKKLICNGCGAKGGWIKAPKWLFYASCNQHDFYYWRGGTNRDRWLADKAFYKFMRKDANNSDFLLILPKHFVAFLYFLLVRILGKKYFSLGKMKTFKDLLALRELNK